MLALLTCPTQADASIARFLHLAENMLAAKTYTLSPSADLRAWTTLRGKRFQKCVNLSQLTRIQDLDYKRSIYTKQTK
eukprot:161722-Hanusia_phi.AAC.1